MLDDSPRAPCGGPVPAREGGLGPVERLGSRLDVDPGVGGQEQADGGPSVQPLGPERAAELREERAQRGVGGLGRIPRPQAVDELVAA
jgi:hypothetical protein